MVLVSYLRRLCPSQGQENLHLFSSKSFLVLLFYVQLWSILNWFLCMLWGRGPTSFFCKAICSHPSIICGKECSFLIELSWHLYQKSIDSKSEVYLWTLRSIPLIYMSILCQGYTVLFTAVICKQSWDCKVWALQLCSFFFF